MGWPLQIIPDESMLGVETRFMIKDKCRKGISISEIARRTGHDRKTVRKVIRGDPFPSAQLSNRLLAA